jgi:elongation factor 1-alpha
MNYMSSNEKEALIDLMDPIEKIDLSDVSLLNKTALSEKIENKVRIAVTGGVDSGKTTIQGVLTSGELDNGRGSGRKRIMKYKHELETGRTSQVSFNYLKFSNDTNKLQKIVTLVDLCGHEKYLKTTLFGLTGLFIDYGLVIVGANMGINPSTKEHLGILLHLGIPVVIIITKVDICPPQIYKQTKDTLKRLLKNSGLDKMPIFIGEQPEKVLLTHKNEEIQDEKESQEIKKDSKPIIITGVNKEIEKYTDMLADTDHIVPIISVSNKTGFNIDALKSLIYNLKPRYKWKSVDKNKTVFYIDSNYMVHGIGLVLSGTVKGKEITVGQQMYVGPFLGEFHPIKIRSIHNNIREPIDKLLHGETGCIACKFVKTNITREQIRKGVVVMSEESYKENISDKFIAKILILHHSTSISSKYQAVIHCGPIRQTARLKVNKDQVLRTGNRAEVEIQFLYRPEFIEVGTVFFFREGRTKGIGEVTKVLPFVPASI